MPTPSALTPLQRATRWASALLLSASLAGAEVPRVFPAGGAPNDVRLQPLKDLNGTFPWAPSETKAAWEQRAARVRRQVLVSQGLWPMLTRTPLNAVIHGKIDRGDHTVEKVYFESMPGVYVTGNLYRPKGKVGKVPGVLSPHGHWPEGRFVDNQKNIKSEIVSGGERFLEGGRSNLQARQVQTARMGCVAFHYDMVGYADNQQLAFEDTHEYKKRRPEMNTAENWGLFSTQAEANLQSVMGLQTWNSIRALDFLLSLPDVDPTRIAVSGESGGGTQTFMLCAVDSRPTVAFPAVMVSTAMQGGCSCETSSLLRVGTGNVELAALFAPKPLGLTSANDWTKEMATKGFPELQRHYRMLGAPGNVMLKDGVHFRHNYNYVSRAAYYSWLNKHFKLGLEEPVIEEDYVRLTKAEMSVWDAGHPAPAGGPEFERRLLTMWRDDARKQLEAATTTPGKFKEVVGGALDVMIGRNLAEAGKVSLTVRVAKDHGDYRQSLGLLRNETYGEELPVVVLQPKAPKGAVVVWVDEGGKAGLFQADGALRPEVTKLLAGGVAVIGADLLFQGEFPASGAAEGKARRVSNPVDVPAFTFGYNHSLFAQRVHDILSVIQYARQGGLATKGLHLMGGNGAGPWVAAARAQAGAAVAAAAIDTAGFRFGALLDVQDANFLPGGAKYFDLPGVLALHAPGKLRLTGERDASFVAKTFAANGAQAGLVVASDRSADAAVTWLLDIR